VTTAIVGITTCDDQVQSSQRVIAVVMPSKRRTKSRDQPKSISVKKTAQMKKTMASGKGRKSGQAGTTAAKKQKSRPLTTADISDIVTAVVEALPP